MNRGRARTLVSSAPRERRIWPWLVLLLFVAVGGSFAVVFALVSKRAPAAAQSSAPIETARSSEPSASVPVVPTVAIATTAPSLAPVHVATPHLTATVHAVHDGGSPAPRALPSAAPSASTIPSASPASSLPDPFSIKRN